MLRWSAKLYPIPFLPRSLLGLDRWTQEYKYYFGLSITSPEFLEFVQTNAGGSAQPQANPPLLGEYELTVPNKESLAAFNDKVLSFLNVIECNEAEISKLNEVKDTMVQMLSSR